MRVSKRYNGAHFNVLIDGGDKGSHHLSHHSCSIHKPRVKERRRLGIPALTVSQPCSNYSKREKVVLPKKEVPDVARQGLFRRGQIREVKN